MFLLTLVPIHLSTDSDRVAVNSANSVDVAEHRVMQLEALYSALIMRQYLGREITGISNLFMEGVKGELDKARNAELELRTTSNVAADNDSLSRLSEVRAMQQITDQRILDLQALSGSLGAGTQLGYVVSGVDNTNLATVNKELAYALQYKAELQTSQTFWTQVVQTQFSALYGSQNNNQTTNNGSTGGSTSEENGSENNNIPPASSSSGAWKLTPEAMASIAASKRNIANWQSLLNSLTTGQTIEQVTSMEEDLKREISSQLFKARTAYNNNPIYTYDSNPAMQKVLDLGNQLKAVINIKNGLQMIDGLQDVATNAMSKEMNNAQYYS